MITAESRQMKHLQINDQVSGLENQIANLQHLKNKIEGTEEPASPGVNVDPPGHLVHMLDTLPEKLRAATEQIRTITEELETLLF